MVIIHLIKIVVTNLHWFIDKFPQRVMVLLSDHIEQWRNMKNCATFKRHSRRPLLLPLLNLLVQLNISLLISMECNVILLILLCLFS